jgi:error-prone DNA polymerase
MEFTSFEDLTGLYDGTFFPATFQKYGHLLTGRNPYLVEGLVEEDLGECTLTVKKVDVVNHLGTMAR